ncbi:flagellar hook-length control protein FliK [Oxalobacter sp. OttesenSCG-928-P03]|nr:flagellar hook-length control protein FliK [Oxalobacter sp. OttesenSCG-928-P03]
MHKFLSSILNPSGKTSGKKGVCAPVTDFLQMHDSISGMLPNATRLIALQKACEQILPDHFMACEVLQLEKKRLTVGVPSQAAAARLRQKLPLLQTGLDNAGWPVEGIRVKVKLKKPAWQPEQPEKKPLPDEALDELEKLQTQLAQSGTHPALMEAVHAMMTRHRKKSG